jgi:hypothetical protein
LLNKPRQILQTGYGTEVKVLVDKDSSGNVEGRRVVASRVLDGLFEAAVSVRAAELEKAHQAALLEHYDELVAKVEEKSRST